MSDALQDFVSFHASLTGDEKSESQIFLDRFFQVFHHKGAIEAGAVYEQRVKKGSAKGKTGFADLVWRRPQTNGKGGVQIEMKKRGEDLNKYYSQAFQYWTYLVPDRPRYGILCNCDEFWIYDFNLQVDVDTIAIASLESSFAVPRVSKWTIFIPFPKNWLAGDKSVIVASDDFYILGILTSKVH